MQNSAAVDFHPKMHDLAFKLGHYPQLDSLDGGAVQPIKLVVEVIF